MTKLLHNFGYYVHLALISAKNPPYDLRIANFGMIASFHNSLHGLIKKRYGNGRLP